MKNIIYLDGYIFACPSLDSGISLIYDYIQNLLEFREFILSEFVDIYITNNSYQCLAEADAYPPYESLNKVITTLKIKHIQTQDVIRIITECLTKSKKIENDLFIEDFDFDKLIIEPTLYFDKRIPIFKKHFEFLIILIALHRKFSIEIKNQILITLSDIQHIGNTNIKVLITDFLLSSNNIKYDESILPLKIDSNFIICKCCHTLYLAINPSLIWMKINCHADMHKAIELFLYQYINNSDKYNEIISKVNFSFGSRFIESCKNLGFDIEIPKIKKILRACAETILNTNLSATHSLRSNEGGNSKQIIRNNDNAKAWRRDIDYEYHLHYWETLIGIEFSLVVTHDSFVINTN